MATLNPTPADSIVVLDALTEKLKKLHAMMIMTYGNAADAFNGLNDEHRDNYLWACATMVEESSALAESLRPAAVQVQA